MTRSDRDQLHDSELNSSAGHLPVMLNEVLSGLDLAPGKVVIDGTFGGGGHSRHIASLILPGGKLLGIDRDVESGHRFDEVQQETGIDGTFFNGSYAGMTGYAAQLGLDRVDAILLDLGLSSLQLADAERGFSFQADGPLDMRFDRSGGMTAADIVNTMEPEELARVFYEYGEERDSRRIARAIVRAREQQPIETTAELAGIVEKAVGGRRGARIHPATRVFQALRIAVNSELDELERGLRAGIDLLAPGGRFVVISFHSLEDRIVKRFFAAEAKGCICPPEVPVCVCGKTPSIRLIGRAGKPSATEVASNPRARSAILRIVERLP